MKKSTTITIVLVLIVLVLGILYWFMSKNPTPQMSDSSQTSEDLGTTNTQNIASSSTPVLTLSTNEVIGSYITATNGMTLYTYKNDSYNTSTCTDACAVTWPPYTVPAPGALSAVGLDGDVETITRPDGTYQVTYQGMPLYFYNKDLTPGDINGNNIGGVWSVATEPEQSGS